MVILCIIMLTNGAVVVLMLKTNAFNCDFLIEYGLGVCVCGSVGRLVNGEECSLSGV